MQVTTRGKADISIHILFMVTRTTAHRLVAARSKGEDNPASGSHGEPNHNLHDNTVFMPRNHDKRKLYYIHQMRFARKLHKQVLTWTARYPPSLERPKTDLKFLNTKKRLNTIFRNAMKVVIHTETVSEFPLRKLNNQDILYYLS